MNARSKDYTGQFNKTSSLTLDVSLWDQITVQAIAPVTGAIAVYGSNDGGSFQGSQIGNASLATNFTPIQAVNLATGSSVSSISAAGEYKIPVASKYIRLAGSGVTVYGLIVDHQRIY